VTVENPFGADGAREADSFLRRTGDRFAASRQRNRAAGETMRLQATQEGLASLKATRSFGVRTVENK
jgi:hypothetical protein